MSFNQIIFLNSFQQILCTNLWKWAHYGPITTETTLHPVSIQDRICTEAKIMNCTNLIRITIYLYAC